MLARASDSSHELPNWLSAWQRERPVVATVATPTPARARLAFASRLSVQYSCTTNLPVHSEIWCVYTQDSTKKMVSSPDVLDTLETG